MQSPEASNMQVFEDAATKLKAALQRAVDRTFPHSKKVDLKPGAVTFSEIRFDQLQNVPTPELGVVRLTDNSKQASPFRFSCHVEIPDEKPTQWKKIEEQLSNMLVKNGQNKLGESNNFTTHEFVYAISHLDCWFPWSNDHMQIDITLMQLFVLK